MRTALLMIAAYQLGAGYYFGAACWALFAGAVWLGQRIGQQDAREEAEHRALMANLDRE